MVEDRLNNKNTVTHGGVIEILLASYVVQAIYFAKGQADIESFKLVNETHVLSESTHRALPGGNGL